MSKINVDKLCSDFEACMGWPYRSPGGTVADCSKVGIDCSGMFVRAFRLQGADIAHGSNTIWRKHLREKGKLTSPRQLERGMAVFKHKEQDTRKYPDGEGDFCHIGLVTGVAPLRIVHASTEGMQVRTDTALGKWSHWGRLSAVEYSKGDEPKDPKGRPESPLEAAGADSSQGASLPPATVTSSNSIPVKLRAKPSTRCSLYWLVPTGAEVQVLSEGADWWHVRWGAKTGYMMREFLSRG